jgi:ABC-type glycerol-3-phosphate transport system substrate-binding protein
MLRDAASGRLQINLVTVPRPSLRQVLMHSVAEGQAPDLAIIDSVWVSEFAAAGFLRILVEDGSMPAEVVAYEWNHSTALLAEGKAAISFGGSYEAAGLADALGVPLAQLWEHVGFVPAPAGPRGAPACAAGTMSYGIFSQTAQPRVALDLLKLAVDSEGLARIARSTGRIPARRSAVRLADPGFPFLLQTEEMLERAVTRPATPSYARVSGQLQAMLEAVLTGRLKPGPAASRTAELIGAITGLPVAHSERAAAKATR